MLLVADALQQNLFLVALFLFKFGVELTNLACNSTLFLQPLPNLTVDAFVKLCRLFLNICDFTADDLVKFSLSDAVRRAVFLAVAVVAVSNILDPLHAIPCPFDGGEG